MRAFAAMEVAGSAEPAALPEGFLLGDDPLAWRVNGVGSWLLHYDSKADVEAHWGVQEEVASSSSSSESEQKDGNAARGARSSVMQQRSVL